MRVVKKRVMRVALCLLALFLLINVSWYVWRVIKYELYNTGMEKSVFATWLVPRYGQIDADGYDYGVKYPDYLTLTGNLSVGCPTTDDDMFTDALIIWPKFFGGYEYGAILYESGETFYIYINADGSAVDLEDNDVVVRHQENIDVLLRKAKEMWDLE